MDIDEQTLYSSIGNTIKSRRCELDLTQEQLALKVGVKRTSITNIESGGQKLPLHLLYRISLALDTDVAQLLPPAAGLIQVVEGETIEIGGKTKEVHPKTASFMRTALEDLDENDQLTNN